MNDKKQLLKIRLRKDGTWEHVYTDGSVNQEFYQMNSQDLAALYTKEREKKLKEYAILDELKDMFIEEAIDYSNYSEAKSVIDRIRKM